MNYLAHMFFSHNSPHSMLGNLLGDFVKGRVDGEFPAAVVEGIRNHREVDAFTDSNNTVSLSRKLISKPRSRFSGVIVDVVYDHFLSRNWNLYSAVRLDEFIETVYKNLRDHRVKVPYTMSLIIEKIIQEDRLRSYGTREGIDETFRRISKRVTRENNLWSAVEELDINYETLNMHFQQFFPELMARQRGI